MDKDAKIFVAGASGMVGSAIIRRLLVEGFSNIIGSYNSRSPHRAANIDHKHETLSPKALTLFQLDLTNQAAVEDCFDDVRPQFVLLAAARVGGILANNTWPAEFIYENLVIQTHVIQAAHRVEVERLLFLGSSCIYPQKAPQPMKEEHLLTGPLEPTNAPYAIAKIAGIKMCEAYNRQYGTRFLALMPTNLYGPNDNFDLQNSHVLPALIRRFHEAKIAGVPQVVVWGSGSPRREFLHVDDMADACLHVMNLDEEIVRRTFLSYPQPGYLNLGMGADCSIGDLAGIISEVVGYDGDIVFDASKPDGTPQKLLDVSRLSSLGWRATIALADGIGRTYSWYLDSIKPRCENNP